MGWGVRLRSIFAEAQRAQLRSNYISATSSLSLKLVLNKWLKAHNFMYEIMHEKHRQKIISKAFLLTLTASAQFSLTSIAADYSDAVTSDAPAAYYRLNDAAQRTTVNANQGSAGAAANATNDLGRVHSLPGAIVGDSGRAAFFDFTSRTQIPWNAALNPSNDKPFTIEAWFYPTSDQTGTGQCPINNRYAYSGADRQGWVFFQRKPSEDYTGSEPVGWNFRMFRGSGGSTGLDVTSLVPYQIAKWTHVVVVYDPISAVESSVTMYIDGKEANKNTWAGGTDGLTPGYVANSNTHDPAQAKFGEAGLAIGNYNNTAGTSLNPYFGGVDEFALYQAKLTPEQILAHYQNATNASRTVSYASLVKALNPVAYLPFDEASPGDATAINLGETRSVGHALHTAEVRYPATSAFASQSTDGSAAYHNRNGKSTTTVPYTAANNPAAGVPFSFEMWVKPLRDQQGGQSPINNRWVGGTGRTGWVMFQRNPNLSYPASEGHGWNFRMYSGAGNSGQDVNTDTDYTIGVWQHLVFTWSPQTDNADPAGNGNNQWSGILTAYVNGLPVNTNSAALYSANAAIPEDAGVAADLGIGSYNAKSGLGSNPFEGNIDEVALYNDYLLTSEQVLAHYQAGTNAHPDVSYQHLVLTAPFTGPERKGPATYLRFADAAQSPLADSGSSRNAGQAVLTDTTAEGPRPPAFAGFESNNLALSLSPAKSWASLNSPSALATANRLTLSAWIKPSELAIETSAAHIISRGPLTVSSFLAKLAEGVEILATCTNTTEISLRIEKIDGVAYYIAGSIETVAGQPTVTQGARFPVPDEDVTAGKWIQLTGVYDGTYWRLYRNGAEVASTQSPATALASAQGDWSIGSAGNGWEGLFSGAIDEVAIYNKALSADRIKAQYTTAVSGATSTPLVLSIARSGANASLTWAKGILQRSDSLTGSYTEVTGAASPFTLPTSGTGGFFRLR